MKATILKTSQSYQRWLDVFGTDTVEIESVTPRIADGPQQGKRPVYQLDMTALSVRQRANLIRFLSGLWKEPLDKVVERIDDPEHGVAIDAADVEVWGTARLFG